MIFLFELAMERDQRCGRSVIEGKRTKVRVVRIVYVENTDARVSHAACPSATERLLIKGVEGILSIRQISLLSGIRFHRDPQPAKRSRWVWLYLLHSHVGTIERTTVACQSLPGRDQRIHRFLTRS
jgi:hypothetical protein